MLFLVLTGPQKCVAGSAYCPYVDALVCIQVHIISAACENMIDGKGMRSGDILQAANGKTVEVPALPARSGHAIYPAVEKWIRPMRSCGALLHR